MNETELTALILAALLLLVAIVGLLLDYIHNREEKSEPPLNNQMFNAPDEDPYQMFVHDKKDGGKWHE